MLQKRWNPKQCFLNFLSSIKIKAKHLKCISSCHCLSLKKQVIFNAAIQVAPILAYCHMLLDHPTGIAATFLHGNSDEQECFQIVCNLIIS